MPIQNIALGIVDAEERQRPDRFHRIAVNEIIETTASIAPNSSVDPVVLLGVLGVGPTPAVKMSMSVLDSLVGVVDRVVDEAGAVVGLAVEPVPGEPIGQPGPPRAA